MNPRERKLVEQLEPLLPWHKGNDPKDMPKAKEFIVVDMEGIGLMAEMAIIFWLGWRSITRWVYRKEILEVMKQQGIDPRDYGYKGESV